MAKRTLESFFKPISPPVPTEKRIKTDQPALQPQPQSQSQSNQPGTSPTDEPNKAIPDNHPTYPIPIPQLPSHIDVGIQHGTPARQARNINNQPHLDLLHFQPYVARQTANELFKFLRRELPFYRVQYSIKRGGVETSINTPRFTTVFGVDDTARFVHKNEPAGSCPKDPAENRDPNTNADQTPDGTHDDLILIQAETKSAISPTKYQYKPRPIPSCLDILRQQVEAATGARYNFCLVNYYASGEDSISFHSDDERFLGDQPNIASLSLGGEREFVMKHKPPPTTGSYPFGPGNGIKNGGKSAGMANSETVSDIGSTAATSPAETTTPSHTAKSQPPGSGTTDSQHGVSQPRAYGPMQLQTQMKGPAAAPQQIKMPLASGDMVVMRGDTQSNWLHSIPKRRGRAGDAVRGRINITFRKAVVPAGTNNYYHYNVGSGPVYRWDEQRGVMDIMK
ncbi:Oxoglutarate/iron-dependent dioxygenase [Penicillium verhagenii]|uniref:Oxoglutarate/iron-dependent dioxygenase n=1 Tax=Penicillium verhagenii TaxID=1562060 RepID=UPI00254542C9|nr:Oxoglutarate/iron-dependent dioxygenase [Penicillium verhagenii]KAJ5931079.1 Oxoglutarate/iron-dependent dioxygenase [Penicillium verhagenii]